MNTNKITKVVISLMLMFGVATSSFAMDRGEKQFNNRGNNNVRIEQQHNKNINFVKSNNRRTDMRVEKKNKHHDKNFKVETTKHHHNADRMVYSHCDSSNVTAAFAGLGLGLLIANAING